jgi:hypothetical protein
VDHVYASEALTEVSVEITLFNMMNSVQHISLLRQRSFVAEIELGAPNGSKSQRERNKTCRSHEAFDNSSPSFWATRSNLSRCQRPGIIPVGATISAHTPKMFAEVRPLHHQILVQVQMAREMYSSVSDSMVSP